MKTKLKLSALIIAILCVVALLMPNQVLATEAPGGNTSIQTKEEVSNLTQLQDALAKESVKEVVLSDTITIDGDVTINGNNKTITTNVRKSFVIIGGKVTFNKMNIINTCDAGRCIDVRDGDVELTLTEVTLQTTGNTAKINGNTEYNQTLNVGGDFEGPAIINLNKTNISTKNPGYPIITFNPVKLTINNSEIAGYAALYMKGVNQSKGSAGSLVEINKSTLRGINNHDEPTDEKYKDNPQNGFGTIVFVDHNIQVNINNSKLIAEGEGTATQVIVGEHKDLGDSDKPNKVTISGNTVITAQEAIAGMKNKNATVILNKGVTSNIEIPAELLASGMMAKKVNNSYVVSEIVVDVVSKDKVGTAQTEAAKETLNESLKANEEVFKEAEKAIKNGEDVAVEIKVEELKQEDIKEEEKQKITAVVSENGKVHQYFDISVLVTANDAEIGKLTELTDKVKLSMKLPKDLVKEGRKFYILKLHGDKVEKIEAVVNGENLEFETKEFSLYALAYEDAPVAQEKDDTPKTGAINIPAYIWVALATIALAGIVTTKKSSKHSK